VLKERHQHRRRRATIPTLGRRDVELLLVLGMLEQLDALDAQAWQLLHRVP
jgi:hypothetical protein